MKEVTKKQSDEEKNILDSLTSKIVKESTKVYACFIPGDYSTNLFYFKDNSVFKDLANEVAKLEDVIINHSEELNHENLRELLLLANTFLETGNYETAELLYRNILKVDSNYVFALVNLLAIYFLREEFERAMDIYQLIPPQFMELGYKEKLNPGADAYRIFDITSLIPHSKKIKLLVEKNPKSSELRKEYELELRSLLSFPEFVKGQEALFNGNADDAFINLAALTTVKQHSHVFWFFIGRAALDGKHYSVAEEYLKKAVALKNNISEYWVALAECFFYQHKNESAIKSLKTAVSLESTYEEAWELAGKMIISIETQKEYDYFLEHLQLIPDAKCYSKFATGIIHRKKFDTALDLLLLAVNHFPNDRKLLEQLASVYERMMKYDDAISIYEMLIATGENVQTYLKKISAILSVIHDDKRLVQILKTVSSYLPWEETQIWDKAGELLMKAKDYLSASEVLRKVVTLKTDDPRILFNLALAYQELQLFKKSEEMYRKVLAINPDDVATLNNLGNVLKELKRYDEAIDIYKKVIALEPLKAISWANLGILYEELKLRGEAKNCYKKAKEIAMQNKDYKSAAKFEEWEKSVA